MANNNVEIKDVASMIAFLKEKGVNHDKYYHYTTWDSLKKILKYKTFLLTRGNSLNINDQHEAHMKGSWEEWNKIYIGSFAFGPSENMAMWGLYGLPWHDAVRLSIPKHKMNTWVDSIQEIKLFENGKTESFHDSFDASLNDVVYASGAEGDPIKYIYRGKNLNAKLPLGADKAKEMTGYVKNCAWQYENEVRLRIRLNHDTGFERIQVSVPDEVIDSINVTTGPYFRWKSEDLYEQLIHENRIKESGFKNLVRYKELCSMCQHESFVKK